MNETREERVAALRDAIDHLREELDQLHKDENGALHEVDALERDARTAGEAEIMQRLLEVYTRLVTFGSGLAQASVDLMIPPTVYYTSEQPPESA
ncbi:MAG: hypothetical protein BWY76_00040 [bacterium ADurb.Bin429]|nr:MAG: hypothetical protein BWY76_00040 [bacterium ADurb.Bin429]